MCIVSHMGCVCIIGGPGVWGEAQPLAHIYMYDKSTERRVALNANRATHHRAAGLP
jgi:hypothetical protein